MKALSRYIPTGSTERRFDDIPAIVYLYDGKEGKPAAIGYGGKRSKPDWHFRFANEERREAKITGWIEGLRAHTAYRAEQKEKMKGHPSSHAQGAASLKADLEKNFPGIKFSVRSKSFSMGDSIGVSWTDGPTSEQVDLIAGAYQEGHFNGMEDIYEYDHTRTFDRGSAKYVTTSRHISPALIMEAAKSLNYDIPTGESGRDGCLEGLDWEQSQQVYRQARKMPVLESKPYVKPQLVAAPHTEAVTITENTEKNGIEIKFKSKPEKEILDELKANGWRWSRFGGCWYTKNTPENMDFARTFTGQASEATGRTIPDPKHTEKKNSPDIAAKLRTLADGMEKAIDSKFNSGVSQQNPTARRLRIAEGMRKDGEQLQKVQFLLRSLADLHEAGNVPPELVRITTKAAAHAALFGYQEKIQSAVDIANGKPQEDPKAKTLRELDRELIGCKIPGFFITPEAVAAQVVELADIREGMEVLEPEAGRGDIAEHINHGSHLTCIEYQQRLAKILELKGFNTICGDFLEHTGAYDRVCMNPPFENGQDIEHTRHAYQLLKPDGRLVSIVGEGAFFRSDKKAAEFREWLEETGAEVVDLPAGAFQGTITSTGVKARIVVIDKN